MSGENGLNGGFVLDLPEGDDIRLGENSLGGAARRAKSRVRSVYWRLHGRLMRRTRRAG